MLSKTRIFAFLLLLFVIPMVMLGCSSGTSTDESEQGTEEAPSESTATDSGSGDEIELRFLWWGSQTRHDLTLEAIELYEEQNPHVTIKPEFLGFDGYWDRLSTQVAAGNEPDIIQMVDRYLPIYVDRGVLADLNPHIEAGLIDTSDIDEKFLQPGVVDDGLYAMNAGSNAFALVYDPAMFEEAGVPPLEPGYTWEDFEKATAALNEKLGIWGSNGDLVFSRLFGYYLRQKGQWLFNEEGTDLGYDDNHFVDFFNYWKKQIDDGIAPPADIFVNTARAGGAMEEFPVTTGKGAMQFVHSNQLVGVTNASGRDLEITIYPQDPNGEKGHFMRASQFFSMSSKTAHPEESAKFIDFLTNNIEANEILAGERGVPVSDKVREHLYDKVDPVVQKTFDYISEIAEYAGEAPPFAPETSSEIDDLFERVSEEIYYDMISPEDGAAKFRAEALKILGK